MLEQLTIKNFAIIDDLTISFNDGLNIFTGETGAGKSIIIDALGLLTGERASASYVRVGTKKAFVEGVFSLTEEQFNKVNELVYLDEQTLIVTKEVDELGKSKNLINGRITTLSNIKKIMHDILDIHSQNDNQYLLDHKYHLSLLDSYGKVELCEVKENYSVLYKKYIDLLKEKANLEELTIDEEEMEYLRFQIKEIEDLDIKENELEELENEKRRLSQFEKISDRVKTFTNEYDKLSSSLYTMKKALDNLANDEDFAASSEKMNDIYYEIDELVDEVKSIYESIDYSEARMEEVQSRIYKIQRIYKKHGPNYEDVINSYNEIKEKLDNMENIDFKLAKVNEEINKTYVKLLKAGNDLHKERVNVGNKLKANIIKELRDLYLEKAQFDLVYVDLDKPSKIGLKDVSFYVSMNPGQPLQPLAKIASGGEVSRLMLGLKVICNKLFGISCTIFDEVDTGVSGKVARAMGLKMQELSKNMQVIAITHLAQVASLGKNHYHVEKLFSENSTKTVVTYLDETRRINEVAKMISGEEKPSINAINNAKELLNDC